jgi:para-nitrobenzyl esterase
MNDIAQNRSDTPADDTEVVVEAPAGALRGRWADGVARFAGIPFAAPPVGEQRFRPPAPAPDWEGVRDARHFGPISPQNPSLMDALFGGEAEQWDEDCLHLNVWTPSVETESPLPVMVWIHGGGFEMGSGSSPLYHGESFAHSGVVYVSINYRLGSLGFLELGHLDPGYAGSGNVGLLDQVAALRWVRDNVAAFGGDAGNVTVFGESAGP